MGESIKPLKEAVTSRGMSHFINQERSGYIETIIPKARGSGGRPREHFRTGNQLRPPECGGATSPEELYGILRRSQENVIVAMVLDEVASHYS